MIDYTFIYQRPVGDYPRMYVIGILHVTTNNVQYAMDALAKYGKDVQFVLNGHASIEGYDKVPFERFKF